MPNAVLDYDGRTIVFLDAQAEDCIERDLLRGAWYELKLLEFVRSLQVGGAYVDVGAYVGTFSIFASLFCPCDRVYAFEPQRDIFAKLNNNLKANQADKCEAFHCALSNWAGLGYMSASGPGNRGGATLEAYPQTPGQPIRIDQRAVGVAPLDAFDLPAVRLLKIDAEHLELEVLRGAGNTLDGVEHLFLETWPQPTCERYGVAYRGDQIAELLDGLGFEHQPEMLAEDTHYWRRK